MGDFKLLVHIGVYSNSSPYTCVSRFGVELVCSARVSGCRFTVSASLHRRAR